MTMSNTITRYPLGSIREIGHIAFPLMLTNLSANLMLFLDRLILSRYSTETMNAAITIGITCSIALFTTSAITTTAEIFVGRHNGAKEYQLIGRPVWQMLWFSFICFLFFIPLALYAGPYLVPKQYQSTGMDFYQWYMFCGPIFPIVTALSSFFVGRGKIKFVTFTMILSNVINLVLAIVLILGTKNIVPALGMKGAAIATITAQLIQAIILFCVFINKHNRLTYGTSRFQFHLQSLLECLSTGVPIAIGYIIEVGAWAFILNRLSASGSEYITVFAIGQSLFILFSFIPEGMQKSVSILASNFMGGEQWSILKRMLFSAIKLQMIIACVLLIPVLVFSDQIAQSFISHVPSEQFHELKTLSTYALAWFWLFFIFDSIKWIFASMLIALKDTHTAMLINFFCVWCFAVIPVYIYLSRYKSSPLAIWMIVVSYSLINAVLLSIRYYSHSKQVLRIV